MDREMEALQQSLSVIIEDASLHGNGSARENPVPDLVKSESDRIKTFYQTVLSAVMVFILAALSGYKDMKPLYSTTGHNKVLLSNLLIAEGLFIFTTFLCAVVLVMLEIFVYQRDRRGRGWYWSLTILVMVTGMMLIVADTILVIFANRNNTWLSVVLAPVMVLVTVAAGAGAWMGEQHTAVGGRYDAKVKGAFDMATLGTVASFGLQGTIVLGYLKAPDDKQGKRDPPLDLAACYASSTVSLILMMVCAMPLARLPDVMLEVLVRFVDRLRQAVLAALAMMALVVSVEFLDGFVVLSVCPEAVAVVLYYSVELFSARQPGGESSQQDFAPRIVAAAGFTLMAGLYAAFLGTDHCSMYLKAAMFLLLLAVLSSLNRLAIPLPEVGGAVALVALAFPAVALLSACPLVLVVLYDHYFGR